MVLPVETNEISLVLFNFPVISLVKILVVLEDPLQTFTYSSPLKIMLPSLASAPAAKT